MITSDIVDAIRTHPPTARRFRETLEEEHVQYFVSDDIPISVGIVDDAVGINLIDEQGVLKGGVKTDNETVHAWAVDRFKNCRENARPVELATFAP